jgi:hypothetical protein
MRAKKNKIARLIATAINLAIENLSYKLGSPTTQLVTMPMMIQAVRVVGLFFIWD